MALCSAKLKNNSSGWEKIASGSFFRIIDIYPRKERYGISQVLDICIVMEEKMKAANLILSAAVIGLISAGTMAEAKEETKEQTETETET